MMSPKVRQAWDDFVQHYDGLQAKLEAARKAFQGIASCSSCPACQGAANILLEKLKDDA